MDVQKRVQAPGRGITAWLSGLALLAGCSSSPRDAVPSFSESEPAVARSRTSPEASVPCDDWSTLECGIELTSHDGLVDCARGLRVCQGGVFGPCVPDAALGVVTVQAPDIVLPSVVHSGVMSVGGDSTECADDVCNPFCQRYLDEAPIPYEAPREDTPTGNLYGGSLQSSNLPPSFKNKGSLDEQCSDPPGSQSWEEACQFDQHCVDGACAAWQPGESGDCDGIDITTPTTCVPSSGDTRVLTVCNRGTKDAPPGVKCYGYTGGSPQFPNSDPGTTNRLLMTTTVTLGAGECETQLIAEALFHQNGIQSVTCNPPDEHLATGTIEAYPGLSEASGGLLPWSSPDNAFAADTAYATASPSNPNGTTTAALQPSVASSFGADLAWLNPSAAFSTTPAASYASAAPAAPAGGAGTIGPSYPGGFDNPAGTGDTSFSNPDRIYAADGSYLSAAVPNPTSVTTRSAGPTSNDAASGWSSHACAYTSGNCSATAKLTAAGTSDTVLRGFALNIPSNAVLDSFALNVKWKSDVNSNKYSLSAQALSGAANTAIGGQLAKSGTYTIETTDTLPLAAVELTGFTPSTFSDANFKVRLRFSRSNGNVTDATASVEYVQVVVKYHLASTTASVAYRYFGLGSIPSNAQVQMTAEVKWKASAVNANLMLGMQAYKNWGSAGQAAIGSEVTRSPAAANTDYVDTTATLTPTPADLIDTSFAIRLRAVRSDGSSNPDVTASIDYVRVNLTWSLNGSSVTHSVYLSGFGLAQQIPSNATITSVVSSASWRLSASGTAGTLGLQAYTAGGATALGAEVTDATSPTSFTTASQTVAAGITASDLSDANFGVRVRISRATAVSNPDFTAYLDAVYVVVTWSAPGVGHGVTYGNFGFDQTLSRSATVTQISTQVRWKSSVSTARQELAFQLFTSDGVALGSEYVDTSSPTSLTTRTQTLSGLSLSPEQLDNGNFYVKVRATRKAGTSNPDFTASLDYLKVTLTTSELVDDALVECNGSNNWTATKLNPSPDECQDMSTPQYVPFTVTRVFQGVCAAGQHPTWRRFGYTTATPGGSSVEFRFRSFVADADGSCVALTPVTSGVPSPLAIASATDDPQVCLSTDPACVVDLVQGLGAAQAGRACLQMDAYGIPSSSDSPQLFDWTVLYDCKDAE